LLLANAWAEAPAYLRGNSKCNSNSNGKCKCNPNSNSNSKNNGNGKSNRRSFDFAQDDNFALLIMTALLSEEFV
jgi:hypothetical protein